MEPEINKNSIDATNTDKVVNRDAENAHVHEAFMREALAMAELAITVDETPVGCVFVHDGKTIARGMNATNRTRNGTRHAEFVATAALLSSWPPVDEESLSSVEKTKRYTASFLKECDLYVTVEPCIMCASLLRQYGIRKVYFGAANERFGGTGGVFDIHSDAGSEPGYEVSGGWLREEAIMLLRRFYVQENEKAPEPHAKKDRKLNTEIKAMTDSRISKQ